MVHVRLSWGRFFGVGLALLAVACPPSVPCATPLMGGDASGGAEYSVAQLEWTHGSNRIAISYPANSSGLPGGHVAGANVPFADDLVNAPVVILLHGNGGGGGDATYTGYAYLQSALARHGITAVSVGGAAGSGQTAGEAVVREVMYRLLAAPFRWRLNLQNIGMMGHSSGGTTVTRIAASPPTGMEVRAVLMLGTPGGDAADFPAVDGYLTLLPAAEGHGTCHAGTSDPTCEGDPGYPDVPGAIEFDAKRPTPFAVQLYVHRANHYSWNRATRSPDSTVAAVPPVFSPKHHELIFRSYATAFFRAILQDMPQEPLEQVAFFRSQQGPISYLNGHRVPSLTSPASPSTGVYGATTVDPSGLVLSWKSTHLTTVDNYQQNNGPATNSLGEPITSGLVMAEQDCRSGCMKYAGRTRMLLLTAACASGAPTCPDASYRTELDAAVRNLRTRAAVLIRAGEPFERNDLAPPVPARGVSFALGLEDTRGNIQWKNADEVGGVPRPYGRNDIAARWVLKTLRFPIDCFTDVDTTSVAAIHIRPVNTDPGRQIAFDDLVLE